MVPGYIAGHYALNDIHIPLEPLCRAAGARFIRATVMGLDVVNKELAVIDPACATTCCPSTAEPARTLTAWPVLR